MAKAKDLAAAILDAAKGHERQRNTWFDNVPAEMQQVLCGIRDRWNAGELTMKKAALHRGVEDVLREQGITPPGRQPFELWLNRKT